MRRMLVLTGILALAAGILGAFPAGANHQPPVPKSQTVTVTVRGNATVTLKFGQQGRPSKPFYGTLELHLRALGLSPTTPICGVVRYSGGVSGNNTVCTDLGRWIWLKRGNFLSASLEITTQLPPRCRLTRRQHTPPHITQRVIMTFWIDCTKAKTTGQQPKQGNVATTLQCVGNVQGAPFSVQATVKGNPQGMVSIVCGQRLVIAVAVRSTAVPVCLFGNGGVQTISCLTAIAGVRGVTFVLQGPVAPVLIPVTVHFDCFKPDGTRVVGPSLGVVVYVNGVPRGSAEEFICSTPKFVGNFPSGTELQFCLTSPVGSTFPGGQGACIKIVITGVVTQLDIRVTINITTTTSTTTSSTTTIVQTTTTTPPPGGGPVKPNP